MYAAAVLGSATLVGLSPDLIWLNIGAQALNAFLLPPLVGLLVALATRALAPPLRPRGLYLWSLIGVFSAVIAAGLYCGVAGLW